MIRAGLPVTLLASVLLTGCFGSGNSDLRQFIETTKASDGLPVEPAPEVPVVEGYAYMAGKEGLRSPFVFAEEELEEEFTDTGIRPDTTRPKEELEAFSAEVESDADAITLDKEWDRTRKAIRAKQYRQDTQQNY